MAITDVANNPIQPTATSFLGFSGPVAEPFPHDIYSFLIESLRRCDREVGRELLLRWLAAAQSEFEATQGRINELLLLYDPELTRDESLPFIKWLVGLTSKLDFLTGGISTADIRRLISVAVRMWKLKGTDRGYAVALGAITGREVRILNYFHFRVIVGEVELGRAELDVDAWLLDEPGFAPSVKPDSVAELAAPARLELELSTLLGASEVVPHDIRVQYVPTRTVQVRPSLSDGSTNVVQTDGLLGQVSPASTDVNDYRVGVDPDEFVSDVRVIDDKSGSPALDRALVENLVRVLRPSSERVYVRYLDWFDTFRSADLRMAVVSGTATPDPQGGRAILEDALADSVIRTDEASDATWTEVTATAQFSLRDALAGRWGELRFYYTDESNFYAVRIDPGTRDVSLDRVTGGTRTTLDSVMLPVFHTGVLYHLQAQVETVAGPSSFIQYFLDGNLLGSATDGDHQQGRTAIATATMQRLELTFAETFQHPLVSTRIGPPPD